LTRVNNLISFNSLVQTDRILDYVPVVSTVTNLVDLVEKCILKATAKSNHKPKNIYAIHLSGKSFLQCAILLVPIVGNLLNILIYTHPIKSKNKKDKGLPHKTPSSSKAPLQKSKWDGVKPSNRTAHETHLKNIWESFVSDCHPSPTTLLPQQLIFNIQLANEYSHKNDVIPSPASLEANPMLSYKNSPDVFFNASASRLICQPADKAHLTSLANTINAAFASGKKIVVTQLANHQHAIAAGFMPNGEFKIIDSMGGTTVDIGAITKTLNQAHIKDQHGKPITFKGEYVNTHIQKGGVECQRFSMLYCYQMAKKCNLNAFEEVNGAFLDGKLTRYEDYDHIETSNKVRNIGTRTPDYKSFMRSWALRICGFNVDDWKQIPLSQMNGLGATEKGEFALYALKQDETPDGWSGFKKDDLELILENEHGKQISILDEKTSLGDPLNDPTATLGSLLPDQMGATHYLIFEKGSPTPRLFRPAPGQKLFAHQYGYADGHIEKYDL